MSSEPEREERKQCWDPHRLVVVQYSRDVGKRKGGPGFRVMLFVA